MAKYGFSNVPEIRPTGLADRLEHRDEKQQVETLEMKSDEARKQRLYLEKNCWSRDMRYNWGQGGMWSQGVGFVFVRWARGIAICVFKITDITVDW